MLKAHMAAEDCSESFYRALAGLFLTKRKLNTVLVAGVRQASPGTVAGMLIKTATSKAFLADHAEVEAFVPQKRCFPAQWED